MTRSMGDSTLAGNIPVGVQVAAGYINGSYVWSSAEWARFPRDKYGVVEIDVTGARADRADVVDCETGDATPATAAEWCASWHALKRGGLPVVYCNRSTRPAVEQECTARGLVLGRDWALWIATLDGTVVTGPGIVACQSLGHGGWDESIVFDPNIWLPAAAPKPPTPAATLEDVYTLNLEIEKELNGLISDIAAITRKLGA